MPSPDTKYYALSGTTVGNPGTVTVSSGFPTIVGSSTTFLSSFSVGDTIVVAGEEHTVTSILNDTHLSTVNNWAQSASGQAYTGYKLSDTLEAHSVVFPKGVFLPYSQGLDLADGSLRGAGWATAEWQWGFITRAQRQVLRSYWPNVPAIPTSVLLRFRTSVNEQNDVFTTFQGQALWPQAEAKQATRRVPFVIRFRALVDLS